MVGTMLYKGAGILFDPIPVWIPEFQGTVPGDT
jgi:hypothetical protein